MPATPLPPATDFAGAAAMLESLIAILVGPDTPGRRALLAHLSTPAAAGALPYVAARLAEVVQSGRRGWRQAAAALAGLGAAGAGAAADQLLKCRSAAGQCRLIGVVAEAGA